MIIYQPTISSSDRFVWHGGESTMLHYEKMRDGNWIERDVQTLGSGVPAGVSELHVAMVDYYNQSQLLEEERLANMM